MTDPVRMRLVRRLVVTLAALAMAATATGLAAPAAQASTASSFTSLINSARASAGLAPYSVRSDLAAVAQGQAQRMASEQKLFHNPSLATQVKNWRYVGENVGYGPDVTTLWNAFMASTPHRDNILDHQFTQVGVGAVTVGGTLWVSMVFRTPMTTSTTTKPTPKPAPKPAPRPTTRTTPGRPTSSAPTKPVVRPLAPGAPRAAGPVVPEGVTCVSGAAAAARVSAVADVEREARLVAQAQALLLGFQCGSRLPMTGVLDQATLHALTAR
jgi:hypothetical protein